MNRPHAGLAGTVAAAAALLAALGPAVAPGSDGTSHSHNSVLAGIENTYGLSLPGGAATASPVPVP